MTQIRQPIITVAGHVDHGKTSILDCFRGSAIQEGEAGGITQKISFTKFPKEQIYKSSPLIKQNNLDLKIPGFLFIDTPGHAAFTNLRKRGGSLADLAILVVDIKEGIKPQTAEVLQILKANKTPFVIALNKVDTISGWPRSPQQKEENRGIKESIENLAIHVKQEFDMALMTFQGAMQSHGFSPELFYEISDFTKNVAIVPCSAKTGEGISELLFVLTGLSEKFLTKRLELSENAKGVLLEIKKEKIGVLTEAILYDGQLKENDEIVIATFSGNPIITKIRSIEEIQPLTNKFKPVKQATAATGIRIHLTHKENLLSGMPFEKLSKTKNNLEEISEKFKKEISQTIKQDKEGIIIKADSLGSLEALITLLKQSNIQIVKAGIGPINKTDIISAKTNIKTNPLNAIILGFNVELDEDLNLDNIKVITNPVVYKLIEDLDDFRTKKQAEIERERLLGLAVICKLQILPQYVFRNSNPAIFGVKVLSGILKKNLQLIDESDENIARVKAIQHEKNSIDKASSGLEVAISLPGTNYERQITNKNISYLYSQISESQFKTFKKNRDLLSQEEIKTLSEIAEIKRKKKEDWGV
ncbi:MAG: translation initiation factor IF-2 [Candidatus Pacearchaeota archaeon]|nr:translation initiation factor IF-2 [Candidatus Pacearchaeota archaeon]